MSWRIKLREKIDDTLQGRTHYVELTFLNLPYWTFPEIPSFQIWLSQLTIKKIAFNLQDFMRNPCIGPPKSFLDQKHSF